MKKYYKIIVVSIILFFTHLITYSQITINNTLYTPTQLVDGVLVPSTSGTTISNVVFSGVYNNTSRYQVGYFSNATTTLAQMGFTNGVVLSTGNTSTIPLTLGTHPGSVGQMATAYTSGTTGEIRQGGGSPTYILDLDILAGAQNYFNAAILEFDFIPVENSVTFRYVFGSEEYTDDSGFINYQCSTYNDKFGFLISGPGISGGQGFTNDARNIARLSNGSEVSINSVNNGVVGSSGGAPSSANCVAANGSWVQNSPTPEYLGIVDGTQLNGNTRILTASQTGLTPGQTYHIKLIVTDVNDGTYDSVVYLEAGSFTTESTCDAGLDQSLCSVTATTLAGVSPVTGNWSVQSGSAIFSNSSSLTSGVTGLSLGTNVLRWTASDLSCFDEITITVNTTPAVPTITTTAPTCSVAGTSTIANFNAANTYVFSPVGPTVGTGGLISGMIVGTSYTVTSVNGSCTSVASAPFSNLAILVAPVTPTVTLIQPTCAVPTGTITITSPLNSLLPSNLFISEVTDEDVGALTYIELFNGTGASINLSNYKIKVYNNGNTFTSCDITTLSGTLANNATYVVSIGSVTNEGGVVPNLTVASCAGINTNDNIRLTTSSNVEIDLWGRTDGVNFTPSNLEGYTYRRLASAIKPSTTWNASEWTAIDPQEYTNVGNYSNPTANYDYSIDGVTYQTSSVFSGVASGTYTVIVRDIVTGCISSISVTINPLVAILPTPTILTTAPTCVVDGTSTISNYNAANTYVFSPVGPTAGAGGLISGMLVGTNYTVITSNGSCSSVSSSSFSNLAMLVTPAVPTITTTAPTCVADGTSTITNYNGALTYTFTPAGPTAGAGGVISGMVVGTSYTVTAGNGSCTSLTSALFNNLATLLVPSPPTISTTAPTCSSDGVSTITNYSGALTYTFTPVGPTAGAGGLISGMVVGTSYTVIADNGSCSSVASASFSNLAMLVTPAVPTITTTAPTCVADGTSTITNYNGALTYTFTPAGPTAGAGGVISGMVVGTSYTVTAGNGSCTSVASASFSNLVMLVTPAVPTISTTAPTCSSDGVSTITNYSGALTYTFAPVGPSVGAGGVISDMLVGTSYTVTSSSGSCSSVASSSFSNLAMLVTPAVPTITTTAPTCVAEGTSIIANYNAVNTYVFTPAGPTAGVGGVISGMVIGTSYTLTSNNGSCTSLASSSFTNPAQLTSPVSPSVTVVDNEICVGQTGVFQINGSPNNVLTYSINSGSQQTVILNSLGEALIEVNNSNTTIVIELLEINNGLCSNSISITGSIDVINCVIPKGVSPNNDGLNDTWDLTGLNAKKAQIFNRYGVEVYAKENYTNEWEGKTNSGDELPSATYYYVVSLPGGVVKTGWVYINREN